MNGRGIPGFGLFRDVIRKADVEGPRAAHEGLHERPFDLHRVIHIVRG
jgi:hypothetical protein